MMEASASNEGKEEKETKVHLACSEHDLDVDIAIREVEMHQEVNGHSRSLFHSC
jgi:hypothetical protein